MYCKRNGHTKKNDELYEKELNLFLNSWKTGIGSNATFIFLVTCHTNITLFAPSCSPTKRFKLKYF